MFRRASFPKRSFSLMNERMFLNNAADNRQSDWLDIKEKPLNFAKGGQEYLMADYDVTALIVVKLEREMGCSLVLKLLASSKNGEGKEAC